MNESSHLFIKKGDSFRPASFSKEYLLFFQFSLTACVDRTINAER
jgi:hypothetical protein